MNYGCAMPMVGSLALSLVLALPSCTRSSEDLVELVRVGNQSALQSIREFSSNVSVTETRSDRTTSWSGEYWRSPEAVRCRTKRDGVVVDTLVRDLRLTRLVRRAASGGAMKVVAEIYQDVQQPIGDCDVWLRGLLIFPGQAPGTLASFNQLLERPHRVRAAERQNFAGRELVYIKIEHELSTLEFWFDPEVNYMVRKHSVSVIGKGAEIRSEAEVTNFQEAQPTIYFPQQVEIRHSLGGAPLSSEKSVFADIRVNKGLPAGALELRIPGGTEVVDTIQGVAYTVDANGKPTSPKRDLLRASSAEGPSVVTPRTETQTESQSMTRWILPASIALLVLATWLWLYRKRAITVD